PDAEPHGKPDELPVPDARGARRHVGLPRRIEDDEAVEHERKGNRCELPVEAGEPHRRVTDESGVGMARAVPGTVPPEFGTAGAEAAPESGTITGRGALSRTTGATCRRSRATAGGAESGPRM